MARKGDNSFYVVNRPTLKYLLLFLHLTPISGSYSSGFLPRGSKDFFEILDLSSPNKICVKDKMLQATAVDRCVP